MSLGPIEKRIPNITKNLSSDDTHFASQETKEEDSVEESRNPAKIDTVIQKPQFSDMAMIKFVLAKKGFKHSQTNSVSSMIFEKGNIKVLVFNEPILHEINPSQKQTYSTTSKHKTYVQWFAYGGGVEHFGLTAGDLALFLQY